jgi:hypothetical protein
MERVPNSLTEKAARAVWLVVVAGSLTIFAWSAVDYAADLANPNFGKRYGIDAPQQLWWGERVDIVPETEKLIFSGGLVIGAFLLKPQPLGKSFDAQTHDPESTDFSWSGQLETSADSQSF